MERETTTITIGNHTLTAKTYLTAKENHAVQQSYFRNAKVEVVDQKPKISDFDPTIQYTVRLELIRQLVTEMDGSSDNIVERCEDMPQAFFDDLGDALDELIAKKKTS
jgi:hypothetical protein